MGVVWEYGNGGPTSLGVSGISLDQCADAVHSEKFSEVSVSTLRMMLSKLVKTIFLFSDIISKRYKRRLCFQLGFTRSPCAVLPFQGVSAIAFRTELKAFRQSFVVFGSFGSFREASRCCVLQL